MIPPKQRRRHIIGDNEEELEERPPVPILSRNGKEKVINSDESEENIEDINVELEAVATRVTHTTIEKKSLLDIIAEITSEGSTAAKSALAASQRTLSRATPTTPKGSSKRKGAISRGATTLKEPEQKRTRPVQLKDIVPTGTPLTSPIPSKKEKATSCPTTGFTQLPPTKFLQKTMNLSTVATTTHSKPREYPLPAHFPFFFKFCNIFSIFFIYIASLSC